MTKPAYWGRRLIIALARPIPIESPGWACVFTFAPVLFAATLVRGTLVAMANLAVLGKLVQAKHLLWGEIALYCIAGFVSLSFFCRLLQICYPKFYDKYKLEEAC